MRVQHGEMARRFARVATLEAAARLGGRELGFEPRHLVFENRTFGRPRGERRPRLGEDAEDAAQHPRVARRQAVGPARIPAERPGVAGEGEPGERGADPHLVLFVREDLRIETADRVNHLAAERRHDEEAGFVGEDLGERDRPAIAAQRPRRLTVARAAAVARVADDDVDVRPGLQHGVLRGEKRIVPLVVAVEKREHAAARGTKPGVARRPRPGIALLKYSNAWIARGIALRDRHRSIHRPIVDDQQLEIAERLPQHGIDRRMEIALGVVRRHDYADGGHADAAGGWGLGIGDWFGTEEPEPETIEREPGTVEPEPGTVEPEPGTVEPEPGTPNAERRT